ncbi:FUSC family protein [Ancylobacter rudongensis]|uniref:Multidrug resistance protein MdtO n=1 Tax=Ancylobacter rudongensis TaxID=177413 RepID=A0A1G4Q4T2_9HYPH|nr:FUSC family protein [Ancylobacter rudongensis]SCW39441.1 multidrug resistance protein MdtO [Ancylobacter rudongensis]
MTRTAESPWGGILRAAWADLQPAPGRFAMTWRIALLCALVCGTAMLYKVPESAISCYLIIFLMRPNGAENVGQALGLIVLISLIVLLIAPIIQLTAEQPLLRIAVIAASSFAFLYLSSASQLGEIGAIIALVIAFVLTLVDQVPAGEIVTRGLLYAWQMAVMPMVMLAIFSMVLGTSPHRLLRETLVERLEAAALALSGRGRHALHAALEEGLEASGKQVQLARLFHTAPSREISWISGAAATTYRLMLAVAALPAGLTDSVSAQRCRAMAATLRRGGQPMPDSAAGTAEGAPGAIRQALADLEKDNGGSALGAAKPPFLAPDAFTNTDHQRYALKTTAAAISCYLIYSLIDWQGIHTAMVTCYVAALGTTGETVHKLALRITGCLIGAMLGLGSILYIIPHLQSVGGLMALVFSGVLVAAWVASGSERISYGGVQIGLAFLLTILDGFGPSTDMDSARDRVVGILLGNLVVYLVFTQIWPKSAVADVRERLAKALAALARLATLDRAVRAQAVHDAALVETELARAREALALLAFEPRHQRPPEGHVRRLRRLVEEAGAVLPPLMFAESVPAETARRLAEAAAQVDRRDEGRSQPDAIPMPGDDQSDALARRTERIAALAAG